MKKLFLSLGILLLPVAKAFATDGTVTVIDKLAPKNGAFFGIVDASQTVVDAHAFSHNLSTNATNAQTAFNQLDQAITAGGGGTTFWVQKDSAPIDNAVSTMDFVGGYVAVSSGPAGRVHVFVIPPTIYPSSSTAFFDSEGLHGSTATFTSTVTLSQSLGIPSRPYPNPESSPQIFDSTTAFPSQTGTGFFIENNPEQAGISIGGSPVIVAGQSTVSFQRQTSIISGGLGAGEIEDSTPQEYDTLFYNRNGDTTRSPTFDYVHAGIRARPGEQTYYVIGNATQTNITNTLYREHFTINTTTNSASFGFVGIGQSTPTANLDLVGTFRAENFNCTTFTNGGKLTTDINGNIECGNDISGSGGAITPGSTFYIQNTNSLQSGSTFYVSSGSVQGMFSASSTTIQGPINNLTANNDTTDPPLAFRTVFVPEGASNQFHSVYVYGKIPNDAVNFGEFVLTVSTNDLVSPPGSSFSDRQNRPEIAMEYGDNAGSQLPEVGLRAIAHQGSVPNGNPFGDFWVEPGTSVVEGGLIVEGATPSEKFSNLTSTLLAVNSSHVVISTDGSGANGVIHNQNTLQSGSTAYPQYLYIGSSAAISGPLSLNSHLINNVTDPASAQDAATKNYVDTNINNVDWKAAAVLGTTAALPNNVYFNGSSGTGATLTGLSVGGLSIDGYSPSAGQRLLIKNEAAPANNGIYSVTNPGSGIAVYVLTRTPDFDNTTDIDAGDSVFVTSGTVNGGTGWVVVAATTIVVGTTPIVFNQFSGPGTYSAASPLTLTGTVFAIGTNLPGGSTSYISAASVVTAGSYGSSTVSPTITFNAQGQIISASSNTISGGGSGSSIYPATAAASFPFGFTVLTTTVSGPVLIATTNANANITINDPGSGNLSATNGFLKLPFGSQSWPSLRFFDAGTSGSQYGAFYNSGNTSLDIIAAGNIVEQAFSGGVNFSSVTTNNIAASTVTVQVAINGILDVQLDPLLAKLSSTAPYISNSTNATTAALFYDYTTTETAQWSFLVEKYDGRAMSVDLLYTSTATTNNIGWEVDVASNIPNVSNNNFDGTNFNVTVTTTVTVSPTSGQLSIATAQLSGLTVSNGNMMTVAVKRNSGISSNSTTPAQLRRVRIYE